MVFCSIRGSQHQTIMLRNIHQDSLLNAFFLSILATAGLFYVNLGGSFLSAFVDGLSIERDAAGFIVSANKYGAAFGGLLAAIFIKKLIWRKSAYILLFILISILLISKLPTYSFKKIAVPRRLTIFLLFAVVLFFGMLLIYTHNVIVISSLLYLTLIPFSIYHFHKLNKKFKKENIDNEEHEDVL